MNTKVSGYCPMGCGETLFAGAGGYITCSYIPCPRPDAVATLLGDAETEHIVELRQREFTVKHPMRERLDDALMACQLHAEIAAMSGPPAKPGRYRVTGVSDGWSWQDVQT